MTTKVEKCQRTKVHTVMREFKEGSLKRRNKKTVKNPKEAIAIALSVARKKCSKRKSKKRSRKISRK